MTLKSVIRRFVLATSVPPFLQLYRIYYRVVAFLASRLFRSFPEVKAIYLRRGGASGRILPLVSDLDFAVFVESLSDDRRRLLLERYRRLDRWTTVLDHFLEIYDTKSFTELYRKSRRQYRFMEGRATWRLLYGRDYLKMLPELAIGEMQHGLLRELKIWWTVFAWRQIQRGRYHDEPSTRNTLCYKATAEVLKMELGLLHGRLVYDKGEALLRARPLLRDGMETTHVDRMIELAEKHFRGGSERLPDETLAFLLSRLDTIAGSLARHPLCRPLDAPVLRVDDPADERTLPHEARAYVDRLVALAKSTWGDRYRGAALVGGFYFDVGERALVLAVDPENPPAMKHLRALYEEANRAWEGHGMCAPVRVYLLLAHAALQVDVEYYSRGWQSVLLPGSNPDSFSLLSLPEYTIDGDVATRRKRDRSAPAWTEVANRFIDEVREGSRTKPVMAREKLRSGSGAEADPQATALATTRAWKMLQYEVIRAALDRGVARIPLTTGAILRAAADLDVSVPAECASPCAVTVLIPCHDGVAPLLREAVDSVRAQTDSRWELVVIDDRSDAPDTIEVLDELRASRDARMRVATSDAPMVTGALNTGMRLARTPFVCMLHTDDRLAPEAVAVLTAAIESDPETDYFHSSRIHVDESGRPLGDPFPARECFTLEDFKERGPVKHLHCWRVAAALSIGGMDESFGPHGADDYDFPWSMLEAGFRFRAIPEVLYFYRDRGPQRRLTTHIPLETQVRELEKIFRKHGMTKEEIERQIAIRKASYLRQALFERDSDAEPC